MSEKEEVIRLIEALPDDVSLEEILRELYIHIKFQRGVQEVNEQRRGKIVKTETDRMLH